VSLGERYTVGEKPFGKTFKVFRESYMTAVEQTIEYALCSRCRIARAVANVDLCAEKRRV
jgi:hypothetical protein